MKKSHKRQFSLLLALSVLASTISVPVSAVTGTDETLHTHDDTPAVMDTAEPSAADDTADVPAASDSTASIATRTASEPITFTVEGSNTTYTLNANDIDLNVDAAAVSVGEETTVDMDNPNMIVIEAELKNIKVLNDDGETVALTDEQIQTVLGMYQQYLNYWAEHADVLGVQMPFFLQYNDNGEDGLGVLGEMLILAGKTVDDVRSGAYTYDELTGTIQTFMMGDQFGVNFYHDAIVSARNEVLTLIKNSGAQTEAQKLLILNDWLAQVDSFDMPYIMNSGKEPGVDAGTMVAEEPTNHKYYQYVYDEIYKQYEAQLQTTFEQQIEDGLKGQMKQQFYVSAIEKGYYDAVYQEAYNQVYASIFDYDTTYENEYNKVYEEEYANAKQDAWDEAYAEAEAAYAETDEGGALYSDTYGAAVTEYKESDDADAVYAEAYAKAESEYADTEAGKATYSEAYASAEKAYTDSEEATAVKEEAYNTAKEAYPESEEGKATYNAAFAEAKDGYKTGAGKEAYEAAYSEAEKRYKEEQADATAEEIAAYAEAEAEAAIASGAEAYAEEQANAAVESASVEYANKAAEDAVAAKADEAAKAEADAVVAEAAKSYAEEQASAAVDKAAAEYADEKADAAVAEAAKSYAETKADEAVAADDEAIKAAATTATEAREDEITAAVNAADESAKATADEQATAAAKSETETFMTENEAAIAEDPVAFCETAFGADAAAEIAAQWDYFWSDCEANGIPGMVEQIKLTAYQTAIKQAMVEQAGMTEEDADAYLEANAEAIAEDPYAFCVNAFGQEGADQMEAGINDQLTQMGIDPSTETNPEGRVKLEVIVAMQMDTPMDDLQGMTPNEAVPVYAQQAAIQLTGAVINYWEGTQFGALGDGKSVCLGYAKAFAYLVQCMHPEIYTTDGDIDNPESWKTAKELYYTDGALDITKNYSVDLVRVTFDASVTMFGETQDNFNSDHFWNAVQIDGQWYYVDPCYTDVFTEVMVRDRVETDGSMNHLYFMFSHSSAVAMYDGNYKEIKTLYAEGDADYTSDAYEDSWMARIKSNVYSDGQYFYYIYDSTDMLEMLESEEYSDDITYKLVRHAITTDDLAKDGDADYEELIFFNYEDTDGNAYVRVADYTSGEAQYAQQDYFAFVTELYEEHIAYSEIYPSLALTAALYEGKIYFNLSNCILAYDLEEYEIEVVKEYNTVYGLRDKTNAFGGMAFSVVDSAEDATFTVENHPLAGLTIKKNGESYDMYVSVATNFAYISGNKDQTGYGYAYEESNYNPNYNTYGDDYDDSMLESFGYEREINDNEEFMWAANFVDTIEMSHFAGTSHTWESVSVDAFCGVDAFTESRCAECGIINPDVERVVTEGTAHEHHYIKFEETYYTKDDSGANNSGSCYVCAECGFHISKPTEPDPDADYSQSGTSYEEQLAIYEEELAIYEEAEANHGHTYVASDAVLSDDKASITFSNLICSCDACQIRETTLDIFVDNNIANPVSAEVDEQTVVAEFVGYEGECTTGVATVYGNSGTIDGKLTDYDYTVTVAVEGEAGKHVYAGDFTWETVTDEDGNITGYTNPAVEVHACQVCGTEFDAENNNVAIDSSKNTTEPSCTTAGADVYEAIAIVTDADGIEIGTVSDEENNTDTMTVEIPALGHDWGEDDICTRCDAVKPEYIISGTVTSYVTDGSDESAIVTITLTDADGNAVGDPLTVTGESGEYSFMVDEGTYKITVSKKNHVPRTYTVTTADAVDEVVSCYVVINPIGDANLDGEINGRDYKAIYDHMIEKEMLDSYAEQCADTNLDGDVNGRDYTAIYHHMIDKSSLWEEESSSENV